MPNIRVALPDTIWEDMLRTVDDGESSPQNILVRSLQVIGIVVGYQREGKRVCAIDALTHAPLEAIQIPTARVRDYQTTKDLSIRFSDEVYRGVVRLASQQACSIDDLILRGLLLYAIIKKHVQEGKLFGCTSESSGGEALVSEVLLPGITVL